jgi:D-3-phosphoglycerate dehydrogenase / 2-oxoglutarate reductase
LNEMPEPGETSQRFVILITEPSDHPALDILRSLGEVRLGHPDRRYTDLELGEALRDCDAVMITSRDRITRAQMEGAPRLKVISKFGARPEKVDLEAAAERGIKVLFTPLANPESVAEHVVLLILAVQRRLCEVVGQLRAGEWRNRVSAGTELTAKTVGLVGFGNVGSRVAEKLRGFNVRLLAYDPWADTSKAAALNVELVDLDGLLRSSDVVSLHAMVTVDNHHMIGEAQLRMMRPTSILINTARGPLVDESALVHALQERWIAGAGLDVYEEEPVPSTNPLLRIDTVVATPHTAAHTREAIEREISWAADDVRRVLLGEAPQHC